MHITRREFSRFAISAIAATVTTNTFAQSDAEPTLKQAEYVFWLDERNRSAIEKSAVALAKNIDTNLAGSFRGVERFYREGSVHLKERYDLGQFESRLRTISRSRGQVVDRVFHGIDGGFRFLPNLNEGEYAIALFDVRTADSSEIHTEQITLSLDNGQWRFVEYFVDTKPFYSY